MLYSNTIGGNTQRRYKAMPDEAFEVGDQVFLPKFKHSGTIVKMTVQPPFNGRGADGLRRYDIKLDDGATIIGIVHGIEHVAKRT